jgi:hypothetical protein
MGVSVIGEHQVMAQTMGVRELRLAVTADCDTAFVAYRDALGLPVIEAWDQPRGGGAILDAGRVSLELLDPARARFIDEVTVLPAGETTTASGAGINAAQK